MDSAILMHRKQSLISAVAALYLLLNDKNIHCISLLREQYTIHSYSQVLNVPLSTSWHQVLIEGGVRFGILGLHNTSLLGYVRINCWMEEMHKSDLGIASCALPSYYHNIY